MAGIRLSNDRCCPHFEAARVGRASEVCSDSRALSSTPAALPDVAVLTEAIVGVARASESTRARAPHFRSLLAVAPGVLVALMPRMACPACWPAYAGALGALGLPVLLDSRWLVPLMATSISIALAALVLQARARRRYAPLVLGMVAAALLLMGKVVLESAPVTYLGSGLLLVASLWNVWPSSQGLLGASR